MRSVERCPGNTYASSRRVQAWGLCFYVIDRGLERSRTNEKRWKDPGKPRAPIRNIGATALIGFPPVSVSLSELPHIYSTHDTMS